MTAQFWDEIYSSNPPPYWNVGIQPALKPYLPNARNDTMDLGCGTGALALAVADQGITTFGIDLSDVAISEATQSDTGNKVTWISGDIMSLQGYAGRFSTLFDSGLLSNIDASLLENYVSSVTSIAAQGADWYMLVLSEQWGRPNQDQINTLLSASWTVNDMSASTILVNNDFQIQWGMPPVQQTDGGYLLSANLITATRK